ncbi:MAG: GAF domain-containing protein [Bacilli bacterium]
MIDQKLKALLEGVKEEVTILSLSTAFLYHELCDVNWLGFYYSKNNQLYLGPFQGLPACIEIPYGKGACGRVARSKEPLIIADTHEAANYIACHSETRSEMVLPIIIDDALYAILDIDSVSINRFSEEDKQHLLACTYVIAASIKSI